MVGGWVYSGVGVPWCTVKCAEELSDGGVGGNVITN